MGQHEEDQGFLIRLGLSVWYDMNDSFLSSELVQHVSIVLYKFPILRRTPKGVWIKNLNKKERFVLLGGRKRYAYSTIQEAYTSFIIRKHKEKRALEDRVSALESLLADATPVDVIEARLIRNGEYKVQL